jgi:DNA-binding NtrC family response regulator
MVKAAFAQSKSDQLTPPATGARVLLVDDDEIFAETAGRNLAAAGYDVHVAGSFQVALEVLDGPRVDVLVTDLVMPHQVNGIALSRMAHMRQKDLKVIFVTGYDIPDGVDDQAVGPILRKPVTSERLIAEVEHALASGLTGVRF